MSTPTSCAAYDPPDSPLSITASVAGILTFVYALIADLLGYLYLFRSFSKSDDSIARFYDAFAACALESDLVLRDILASSSANLVLDNYLESGPGYGDGDVNRRGEIKGVAEGLKVARAIPLPAGAKPISRTAASEKMGTSGTVTDKSNYEYASAPRTEDANGPSHEPTKTSPYLLNHDSLARLYSHVRAVEIELQRSAAKVVFQQALRDAEGTREWSGFWDRMLSGGKWVNRAGELRAGLEKREALTPSLLVVQMSLNEGRLRSLEKKVVALERRLGRLGESGGGSCKGGEGKVNRLIVH